MELRVPSFRIKSLLIVFFFALPLAAQTRADLDKKYGPTEGNVYRIAPGIALEATFSENGNAKTFRILPDNPKDEKARIRIEDVRKLAYELLGGRMCYKYRPRNTERIDIECPPKKAVSD